MPESASSTVSLLLKRRQEGLPASFSLREGKTTIGRHPSNDIVLPMDSVSRFHAEISPEHGLFLLEDLNSSNGTFVNEERVTRLAVHDGDVIRLGQVELVFRNLATLSEERPPTPATSSSMLNIVEDEPEEAEEGDPSGDRTFLRAEEIENKRRSAVLVPEEVVSRDRKALVKMTQRLSVLYRLSELLRGLDVHQEKHILQRVLDLLFQVLEADRGVFMVRFHRHSEELEIAAVKYREQPINPPQVAVSRAILKEVLGQRMGILSRNVRTDERFGLSDSILFSKVQSTISAPLIVGEEVLGVLHLDTASEGRSFVEEDLEFVTVVAAEVGVALAHMRMQKEAIHRQRLAAVGETVAGISHNVKNILLLSQGGADLVERALEKGDLDSARESWAVVSRGIDRIGGLVREMLQYSSDTPPQLTEVNLNELVASIASDVHDRLIEKRVGLEVELDEEIPPMMLDETGLQRTLMNLLVNAIEAIDHDSGAIRVSTDRQGKLVTLSVSDNGAGIPQEKLEKIFLPFFTTKGSQGTGLGLPMCKKCVEDMGGTMRCESEEGVGTTFYIELRLPGEEQTGEEGKPANA